MTRLVLRRLFQLTIISLSLFVFYRTQVLTRVNVGTSTDQVFQVQTLLDKYKHDTVQLRNLDETYNITNVEDYRLGDVDFLDDVYFYNKQVIKEQVVRRMNHIEHYCAENIKNKFHLNNLYQFNELGLSWCPVFKSGSTSWKNFFIEKFSPFKGIVTNRLDLLKARLLRNRMIEEERTLFPDEMPDNIRFTVVRHPLSRIISHAHNAHKDQEMVNMQNSWIRTAVTRNRQDKIENKEDVVKFKNEFDEYFKWLMKRRTFSKPTISDNNPFLHPPYPEVDDLINHIKSSGNFNGHWAPAWEWCDVCSNKYDYIIKLEEQPLEQWFLLDELGIWSERHSFIVKPNSSNKPKDHSEYELLEKYNNSLTLDQRTWFNKYYKNDLELFDYDRV